jgi:hypothetical protein
VIVTTREEQLLVVRVYPLAYRARFREIEGRPGDGPEFAGWNEGGIDRREAIRVDEGEVAEDVAVSLAFEIEIAVIGEVDGRRCVGDGPILYPEGVVVR